MNQNIQNTLLQLCNQVINAPETTPDVPVDVYPEGSDEWRVLSRFRSMLESIQQSKQKSPNSHEVQYLSVFEATTNALFIHDLDGIVVEVNPAACTMYGYTREEFIGMHPFGLIDHDSRPSILKAVEMAKVGDQGHARSLAVAKDGTLFHTEVHITQFLYKGQPHLLTSVREMTEQMKMEEQLREKEVQYHSIFEATSDALIVTDAEGFCTEANSAACIMYGYTREELVGKHFTDCMHPDTHAYIPAFIQKVLGGKSSQTQTIGVRKDGSLFYGEAYSAPFTYQGKLQVLSAIRDVTEHRQTVAQLREKEEQYRSIFEATGALIVNDPEGFVVEANSAACEMLGYTREELIGMNYTKFIPPDLHPFVARYLRRILAGHPLKTNTIGIRKDGTSFHADTHGTPFTYLGKPHILSSVRDVTERIHAEAKLREKEEQYRAIFEASTDALFIQEIEDGRVVEVNPAACKMHGFTYEEFIGLLPSAFIYPDSANLVTETLQTLQKGGQYQALGLAMHKDGTPFYADASVTMFAYKGKPRILSVVRDVTEQIESEAKLREKEAQYRSIFESSIDGLMIADLNGYIVEANPAVCQMYGYTYEEFVGLHGAAISATSSVYMVGETIQTIRAGGRYSSNNGVGLRKDGTTFPVEGHATPFLYKGQPHILAVVRDITERVQAEEQVRKAYQLLEQRVEERTHELSTLLEISHNVVSTIELRPLVGLFLQKLQDIVNYGGAGLATLEDNELTFLDYHGPLPQERITQMGQLFAHSAAHQQVLRSGEPLIITDVYDGSPLAQSLRRASRKYLGDAAADYMHSWMGIPLKSKERVVGLLSLSHPSSNFYTPQHARMALAIANQAAVAIENARLYEQAQELAAIQERQRLARELHDSVSQALYGISLGTHTARALLDRDPSKVAEPLDYVLSLAEAALIEMRALIFELRPESLASEGLVSALTKQAAAMQARHGIVVFTEFCEEPDLPLKVKKELHRVAQEALHNTMKHAQANSAELRLTHDTEGILLEIRDDGIGFIMADSFPGHLGLHSMRERIAHLGGILHIESAPGQGTLISAWIPAAGIAHIRTGTLR